ncbi:MAG: outer membrane beta-barrel protein [Candidatus Omnitrophica bacterium]|nr:outer membrane beta-barrel protein [Candidatus Omnitrophota bacterium]
MCERAGDNGIPGSGNGNDQKGSLLEEARIASEETAHKVRSGVRFHVDMEEGYDDNIYRTNDDMESDYITSVKPGISYDFTPAPIEGKTRTISSLTLDLGGEIVRYAEHGNLNRDTLTKNIFSHFNMESVFFDRVNTYFSLERKQRVAAELYPEARTSPTSSSRDRLVDYWTNNYGANYNMGAGRYTLVLGYGHSDVIYESEEDKVNNNIHDTFSLSAYMDFMPDTQLFLTGSHTVASRPKSRNNDVEYDNFSAGITGKIAPKTNVTVSAGYTMVDAETGDDTDSIDASLSLEYQLFPRLTFNASASRSIQDMAEQAETATEDTDDRPDSEWATDITSQYARVDRLFLGVSYFPSLDERLSLRAGVSYNRSEYDSGREDKTYRFDLGAGYQLNEWLSLTGKYTFRKQISDIDDSGDPSDDQGGYENNVYTLGLSAKF